MHPLLLHNDEIQDAREPSLAPGQTGLMAGWGVFSTIRVNQGVLFAYERHFERMRFDAEALHVPFPDDPGWLQSRLLKLVEANGARDATLRVCVVRNKGGQFEGPGIERDFDLIAFTRDLADWGESVRLAIKPHARYGASEFSGTKMLSWAQNLTWYEEAHQRGYDEVVLLNEKGEVCECTSANVFVVRGSQVATPPLSSGCLPGVTRALLLEEIRVAGIEIGERALVPKDLEDADQVFITSSTRDLLPVREVESLRIRSEGQVVEVLSKAFREYREGYVAAHQAEARLIHK
jgi:branched-chain amino acid aminotransferase